MQSAVNSTIQQKNNKKEPNSPPSFRHSAFFLFSCLGPLTHFGYSALRPNKTGCTNALCTSCNKQRNFGWNIYSIHTDTITQCSMKKETNILHPRRVCAVLRTGTHSIAAHSYSRWKLISNFWPQRKSHFTAIEILLLDLVWSNQMFGNIAQTVWQKWHKLMKIESEHLNSGFWLKRHAKH